MSEVLKKYNKNVISYDLIDRGYQDKQVDFLKDKIDGSFDLVITNPPFKYALEFIQKGLEISDTVVILAKIQLLEGQSRSKIMQNLGLKEIYGYVSRCNCWRNGLELNPKTNKPWSGAMFLAWYVFEKGYKGKPEYNWLF